MINMQINKGSNIFLSSKSIYGLLMILYNRSIKFDLPIALVRPISHLVILSIEIRAEFIY